MKGMTTCERCNRKIKGRMIYAGGAVWHPACYPYQRALAKGIAKRKAKSKRRKK